MRDSAHGRLVRSHLRPEARAALFDTLVDTAYVATAAPVLVVNETFVRRFVGDANALGAAVRLSSRGAGDASRTINHSSLITDRESLIFESLNHRIHLDWAIRGFAIDRSKDWRFTDPRISDSRSVISD